MPAWRLAELLRSRAQSALIHSAYACVMVVTSARSTRGCNEVRIVRRKAMVSQCANPDCGAPFLYMREGRVVAVRRGEGRRARVEFFWLCGACASHLRLETAANGASTLVHVVEAPEHTVPQEYRS